MSSGIPNSNIYLFSTNETKYTGHAVSLQRREMVIVPDFIQGRVRVNSFIGRDHLNQNTVCTRGLLPLYQ